MVMGPAGLQAIRARGLNMRAVCPRARLHAGDRPRGAQRGRANVYLRSPYMTSLAQSISDMSNDRH